MAAYSPKRNILFCPAPSKPQFKICRRNARQRYFLIIDRLKARAPRHLRFTIALRRLGSARSQQARGYDGALEIDGRQRRCTELDYCEVMISASPITDFGQSTGAERHVSTY